MLRKSNRTTKNTFKKPGVTFGLGLPGGLWLNWRKSHPKKLPYLRLWQKLRLQEGQARRSEIRRIAGLMQANYERLYKERTQVAGIALKFHQDRNALAALAIYQILLQEGVSQVAALEQIENVARQAFLPVLRAYALLKHLPNNFGRLRRMVRTGMKYIFPKAGFKKEWLENSEDKLAFNMRSCFYFETFKAYGAPELTAIFCKLDDVLFEQLPPTIRWERTSTLGRGGDMCNFQWSKVDVSGKKPLNVIQS